MSAQTLAVAGTPAGSERISLTRIFTTFLLIGATSVGGGVVAYLRRSLVQKEKWLDDKGFVELLVIAQTMPGLNATNMAVLAGDRLRGPLGSAAAIVGVCLPGALIMTAAAVVYTLPVDRTITNALLKMAAAAASGLLLSVCISLGKQSLHGVADIVILLAAVAGVNWLRIPVPYVLLGVGAFAVWWYRPR